MKKTIISLFVFAALFTLWTIPSPVMAFNEGCEAATVNLVNQTAFEDIIKNPRVGTFSVATSGETPTVKAWVDGLLEANKWIRDDNGDLYDPSRSRLYNGTCYLGGFNAICTSAVPDGVWQTQAYQAKIEIQPAEKCSVGPNPLPSQAVNSPSVLDRIVNLIKQLMPFTRSNSSSQTGDCDIEKSKRYDLCQGAVLDLCGYELIAAGITSDIQTYPMSNTFGKCPSAKTKDALISMGCVLNYANEIYQGLITMCNKSNATAYVVTNCQKLTGVCIKEGNSPAQNEKLYKMSDNKFPTNQKLPSLPSRPSGPAQSDNFYQLNRRISDFGAYLDYLGHTALSTVTFGLWK